MKRGAPRILRILIPALIIIAWFTAASIGGPYFGRISDVSSNDQASYLPANADATRVAKLTPEFTGNKDVPAILVFVRAGGLTDADRTYVAAVAAKLAQADGVSSKVSPPIESDDHAAMEIFAPISGTISDTVEAIRSGLDPPAGLSTYVTGPAGFTADLVDAFSGIDGILLLAALGSVFLILLLVYRSPLLPLIVLGTAVFSLTAAILAVWWLAYADIVKINGQVQGILFILVIGAATDYSLLYVSRYREALRVRERRWDATWTALRGAFGPILASGGTVIVALLCLLFSDLNSNKALGPVAAIGIGFALLGALTLLPALLLACGRAAFWPFRPKFSAEEDAGQISNPTLGRGLWPRIARLIARHARIVWIAVTVVLLAAGLGLTQLKADGVAQSALILGHSEARDGQTALGEHFPAGSGSPAYIVGSVDQVTEIADAATGVDGVDTVVALSQDSPSGTVPVGTGAVVPTIPGTPPAAPTVVNGQVMLQATLDEPADSAAAEQAVRELRVAVAEVDPDAIVGGVTATNVDTNDTSIRDRMVIIPIVLLVILLILMLLLRAVVAPLVLIGTVILSFAATLGISALVFNGIFHFPGADPSVPLYAFVFLVALGVDYNIFLMTRVREESTRHGTRSGILRGLVVTGGVITSAGVVLAATFAALSVIPILFLVQLAFIVAFGVLLDTLIVRTLLVPAASHDIGRAIWWPSKLGRFRAPEEEENKA